MCILPSDIGNRITELSKVMSRMHNDMKIVHQHLVDEGHPAGDALTKDSSSFLGKYIIGAKNNFRGFNNRHDEKNTSLKVTVHHGEEEEDKEKVDSDTKQESGTQQNQVGDSEAEGSKQVTDCDVVKMEEGRAKVEQRDEEEAEKKEQTETDKDENTDNEVKGEIAAGTSFDNVEEKVKAEGTQDGAEKRSEGEALTGAKVNEKHTDTSAEQAESIKENEQTDKKKVVNKFKDIELQEKKVEARWVKGRKFEHNVAERSGFRGSNEKPGAKKIIPSPTGSSSSQDTGFGSQEGEGSIDGMLVRP